MTCQPPNNALPEPRPYRPGETSRWNAAWCSIYDHFADAILIYAKRRGLNDHSAEDVLQEVMTTLIRCQYGQEPRRDKKAVSFQDWLRGVIRNRVHSVRRMFDHDAGGDEEETRKFLLAIPGPPEDFADEDERQWQHSMLVAAMLKVKERVSPDNFAIYTALIKEEASAEELSRIHGKDPKTIYTIKHRCEKMLLTEASVIRDAWQKLEQSPAYEPSAA